MGWIPDEWQDKKVRDLLELKYGKGLKKSERIEGHYPVYGSGGINGYHNSYLVEGPGVIVGRKGTVGTVFWESKSFFPIDTTFYVVPRKNIPLQFCYYLLKGLGLDTMNTDAAVPGLNRENALSLSCLIPKEQLLSRFDKMIFSYKNMGAILIQQNKSLESIKERLLPKLIGGKIDLREEKRK